MTVRLPFAAAFIIVPILLMGCDDASTPAPTSPTVEDSVRVEQARRLGLGKADHTGSCVDSCGAKSQTGSCWCDAQCATYGDCCGDKVEVCDAPTPPPICQPVMCALYCEFGFQTGDDGCAICACVEPPPLVVDTCEGACGSKAASGNCWCDASCAEYGDCCADKADVCDAPPVCPNLAPPPPDFCDDGEEIEAIVGDNGCVTGFSCVPVEPPPAACFVGGCSSQLCGPTPGMVSTCEFKPEYACYPQHGTCEAQPDGSCGWTPTAALQQCIADAQGGGCQPVLCELYCEYGFATGDDGCEVCSCNPPPAPAPACAGHCGGQSDAGCWCDAACASYGDCCADKAATCGE